MPLGERVEFVRRAQEVAVGAQLDALRQLAELLAHPKLAGLQHDRRLGLQRRLMAGDLAVERAGIGRIVQLHIADRAAAVFELGAEVPHRREEIGDSHLVLRDIGRLLGDLHLQHDILRRIEAVERSRIGVELVAQHDDEMSHGSSLGHRIQVRRLRPSRHGRSRGSPCAA
ncbi:hypothetical protein ACVIJ6_007168 [Bradyrhizobium sp. USDA 4369]